MPLIKKIVHFFLFTHLYLGLCVGAFAAAVHFLWWPSFAVEAWNVFLFASTVGIYSFFRLRGIENTFEILPNHYYNWVSENTKTAKTVMAIALLFTFFSFNLVSLPQKAVIIVAGVLMLLYNFSIFFPSTNFRLRNIGWLKPFWVSLVCMLLFVVMPNVEKIQEPQLFSVAISSYFFLTAILLLFEIKDERYDRIAGLKTLPQIFGIEKMRRLIIACLTISALLPFLPFDRFQSPLLEASFAIHLAFIQLVYYFAYTKTNEYFYWVLIDGWMLLVGLYVLLCASFNAIMI